MFEREKLCGDNNMKEGMGDLKANGAVLGKVGGCIGEGLEKV